MIICLERGADLHTAQLMPLPLTVSCFSKIQIGFTFLVPAHLDSPGKRAVKRVCVLLTLLLTLTFHLHLSSLWDTIRKSYLARAAEPDHGILKVMGLKVMQKRCSNKKQLLFRSK